MIVGLDIDGTISKHPELFRILSKALRNEGHSVHIVTCRMEPEHTEKDLESWGIEYDRLHLIPVQTDLSVADWKRKVCEDEGLDFLFDDSPDVLISTPGRTHSIFVM